MTQKPVYLIIAGGTGGHIVPGLGLALEFAAAGETVHFLSLEKNRAYADFKDVPFPVHFYAAPPIARRPMALLAFPLRFLRALLRARRVLRECRVTCVIGMGGYSIFPGILAARLGGVPYYLCEQNAIPGRATRLFAGAARRVFLNFPIQPEHRIGVFASERVQLAGNPLRPALKAIAADSLSGRAGASRSKKKRPKSGAAAASAKKASKKKKTGAKKGARGGLSVLVLGGSQGAAQINAMVAAAIPELRPSRAVDRWIIQCGAKNLKQMRELLPEAEYPEVTLLGYHPGIAEFYREADLLIARAGAGVVSEALVFGLPMILIPYPFAADNHQLGNAEFLKSGGVAHCISRRDSDPAGLIDVLREWSAKPAELEARSDRALALARPEAAGRIRDAIIHDLAPSGGDALGARSGNSSARSDASRIKR